MLAGISYHSSLSISILSISLSFLYVFIPHGMRLFPDSFMKYNDALAW